MAFKKFNEYVENKNGVFFTLPNDKDQADVIFLYQSADDVLVADTHYLSTDGFKGYAHCLGKNCPACNYRTERGGRIRKQESLFIPLFNLNKRRIEFWDRTPNFEHVLHQAVFKNYPNPSEYVFTVTRNGQPRDPATRYEITVTGRNSSYSYDQILSDHNMTLPEGYNLAVKELTYEQMDGYLNSNTPSSIEDYGYTPIPRGQANTSVPEVEPTISPLPEVSIPTYSEPPMDLPSIDATASSEVGVDPNPAGDDSSDSLDDVKF